MSDIYGNASGSSSSSVNSSSHDTEDDHTIAAILSEDEKLRYDGKLGKMLSHLDSIPHTPRVIQVVPDAKDATLDHERLAERFAMYRLAEMQIEGDGNCQFRALADQLYQNQDYHKDVRKDVVKQLKRRKNLYESYVPIEYEEYVRKMKSLGEWGDHVTLQAAADKFEAKICLVTSFRDACYIEILPKDITPSRELWLSFWSEVHYNSLYQAGEVPTRTRRKKHWLF
ncbi:OVARIAN TUMOR DOMAIN-containing deubiquitinating enzyme 11 [Orobanche minor]